MVQTRGRQHGTFGLTKVRMEVHGVGGVDELRVPYGVAGVLVHPRVETGAIASRWCVRQRTPREAAEGVGGAGTPRSRPPGAGPGVAGASRIPTSPPPCTRGLSDTGLWPVWCNRHPPWSGPITWRGFPGVGDDSGDSRANSTRETRRRCAWWHRSRRRCSGCPGCGTRPGSVRAGAVGLTGLPPTSTTA